MRFLLLVVFFTIGLGICLHAGVEVPYIGWLGHLPGDLLIRKNGTVLYFPMTSSLIVSIVFSMLFRRS